jgi:predicted transcriptional regulator
MTEKTFLIRLSDAEREALRQQAATEHRSMQEVARLAVLDRIELTERRAEVHATLDRVMARDADLLDRLAK